MGHCQNANATIGFARCRLVLCTIITARLHCQLLSIRWLNWRCQFIRLPFMCFSPQNGQFMIAISLIYATFTLLRVCGNVAIGTNNPCDALRLTHRLAIIGSFACLIVWVIAWRIMQISLQAKVLLYCLLPFTHLFYLSFLRSLALSHIQSNVCNQLKKETSEEPILLKRSSSPSSTPSFMTSVLNSPRSVDDTMMDKSSGSPSVALDLDELETNSVKSNDVASSKSNLSPKAQSETNVSGCKAVETKEPEVCSCMMGV